MGGLAMIYDNEIGYPFRTRDLALYISRMSSGGQYGSTGHRGKLEDE